MIPASCIMNVRITGYTRHYIKIARIARDVICMRFYRILFLR